MFPVFAAVSAQAMARQAVGAVHFWWRCRALQPLLIQVRRILPEADAPVDMWQQPGGSASSCLWCWSYGTIWWGQLSSFLHRYICPLDKTAWMCDSEKKKKANHTTKQKNTPKKAPKAKTAHLLLNEISSLWQRNSTLIPWAFNDVLLSSISVAALTT